MSFLKQEAIKLSSLVSWTTPSTIMETWKWNVCFFQDCSLQEQEGKICKKFDYPLQITYHRFSFETCIQPGLVPVLNPTLAVFFKSTSPSEPPKKIFQRHFKSANSRRWRYGECFEHHQGAMENFQKCHDLPVSYPPIPSNTWNHAIKYMKSRLVHCEIPIFTSYYYFCGYFDSQFNGERCLFLASPTSPNNQRFWGAEVPHGCAMLLPNMFAPANGVNNARLRRGSFGKITRHVIEWQCHGMRIIRIAGSNLQIYFCFVSD